MYARICINWKPVPPLPKEIELRSMLGCGSNRLKWKDVNLAKHLDIRNWNVPRISKGSLGSMRHTSIELSRCLKKKSMEDASRKDMSNDEVKNPSREENVEEQEVAMASQEMGVED
ncbi:hypothetical protein SUGI_0299630 [Cryptomeria japonica]|nr:hypothetical protein SUGI_0299630 [Cryptomeria japonica]